MCCHNSSCRPSGFLSWMASWLTFPLCPLLSAPLAAISVVRAVRSGSAAAMTRSALLSPFVVVTMCVAIGASADYSRGRAVWHTVPDCCSHRQVETTASWSIHTKTRAPIDARRPHGHQYFTWRVSNRVVKTLHRLFGPQRGAYAGSLPSPVDVEAAFVASGRLASPTQMQDLMGYVMGGHVDEAPRFDCQWAGDEREQDGYRNAAGHLFGWGKRGVLEAVGT
ncbi:MAG: hypothetical protein AAB074_09625, partial [Planctomycetota bacterium]